MKGLSILLCTLLLSSCAWLPIHKGATVPTNEADIIQRAEKLRKGKFFSEAEHMLFQARINNPDSIKLQRALRQVMIERHRYRQQIEDQLLIARVTFIQQQRPLVAQLATSESDDRMISARLNHMNSEWFESRQQLSECGKRRLKSDPKTAEKCLRLALSISEKKGDRRRLSQLNESQTEAKNIARQQKVLAEKNARQRKRDKKITQLLEEAHNKQQAGEHSIALNLIKQILELSPGHTSATLLEEQLNNELTELTDKLLTKGEQLYQNDQFKEAIVTWKTVLTLNPKHKAAAEKINRAQRVLDNLKELRKEQKPTPIQTN